MTRPKTLRELKGLPPAKPRPLSPQQLRYLVALRNDQDPGSLVEGRSAHGGMAGTRASLHRLGLIFDDDQLTTTGIDAVDREIARRSNLSRETDHVDESGE